MVGLPSEEHFGGQLMGQLQEGKTAARQGQLQQLRDHHRAIARALLAGVSSGDVAAAFHMTPSAISVIKGSPLFQVHMSELQREADEKAIDTQDELVLLQPFAVETIAEALLDKDQPLPFRTKTAFELLGATGVHKGTAGKGSSVNIQINLQAEDAKAEKMSDKELRGDVFDLLEEE